MEESKLTFTFEDSTVKVEGGALPIEMIGCIESLLQTLTKYTGVTREELLDNFREEITETKEK